MLIIVICGSKSKIIISYDGILWTFLKSSKQKCLNLKNVRFSKIWIHRVLKLVSSTMYNLNNTWALTTMVWEDVTALHCVPAPHLQLWLRLRHTGSEWQVTARVKVLLRGLPLCPGPGPSAAAHCSYLDLATASAATVWFGRSPRWAPLVRRWC